MKVIKPLVILSITLMYLILMFLMWANSQADADVINSKLQLLSGEGYGLYYFIISTCCLFLLWNGARFSFGKEIVHNSWLPLLQVICLFLFEFQIILLTFDMGLDVITIKFLIGIFSTVILGIFSFSAVYDMVKGFSESIKKK